MQQVIGEIKDTVKGFFFAYAVKRNIAETLSFLTEEIRWVGSGAVPAAQGKRQVAQVLEAEFAADSTPYNVAYTTEDVRQISQDTAEVFFEIELDKALDGRGVSLTVQLFAICRRVGFLYKICSIHTVGINNVEEEIAAPSIEKTFEEHQNRFKNASMDFLQESIPGGIIGCYLEPGFPLYFINDRMLEYLGYSEEDLVFETEGYVSRCVYPEDMTYVETYIDRRLKDGDEYELRYRMKRKDKGIIWVAERGRKAVNDLGRMVVIRVLFDITEIVELQEQMLGREALLSAANREMEDLYHTMVHGGAKVVNDEDFTIVYANSVFYQMLGYSVQDFMEETGNRASALIHPEDLDQLKESLLEMTPEQLKDKLVRRLRLRTADRKWLWVQMEAALSSEVKEDIPVFYCSFMDVEEIRAAEQEQKRQRHFLSLIASAVMGGMMITETDGDRTFAYIDDNLLRCMARSRGELQAELDNTLYKLILPEDLEKVKLGLAEQAASGEEFELEYRLKKGDGSIAWVQEKGKLAVSEEGQPILISLLHDITKQKQEQKETVGRMRTDPLTKLLNQDYIKQSIRVFLEKKPEAEGAGLLLVDLDDFKQVNDIFGHLEGDRVLVRIAEILTDLFPQGQTVGRVDSDRFLILLSGLSGKQEVDEKAEAVCKSIHTAFYHHFSNCDITASVGAAVVLPGQKVTFREMYKLAGEALYQAKFRGKNQYCLLDKDYLVHAHMRSNGMPDTGEKTKQVWSEDDLSHISRGGRGQWMMIAAAAAVFLASAAGLIWVETTQKSVSMSVFLGLLSLMVLCPVMMGIVIGQIQKKVKGQLEAVMERCRVVIDETGEVACYDSLLKIGNRTKAAKDMEALISSHKAERLSLFLLDIQEFSKYNDVFSIRTGDEIIKGVHHRLSKCFGESLYRVDGDVFLGISPDEKDERSVSAQIQKELENPIRVNNVEIKIEYNLGICHYPEHGENAVQLLERAHSALNYAKKQDKINVAVYNEAITSVLRREGEILSLIRKRIAQELLEVWYQPIYDLRTGQFTTAEALLRLRDDRGTFVETYYAILVAEKNDAIGEIGEYVLRAACQTVKELQAKESPLINIHVNLSVQQVAQPNFAERTLELVKESGADPSQIGVEVTETALIQSFDSTVESLMLLKEAGMQIALDDFGSGYSSLNYLARLPIDRLKLDRQLVLQVNDSEEQLEFIKTIVQMAKIKNMQVVAEGVEDADMLDKITQCDVKYIQGFYYSKPLPKDEFISFMCKQKSK